MTNDQDKPVIIGVPVEIESAVNEIRLALAELTWIDHPYFIAQRFLRDKDGKKYQYPETYATQLPGDFSYHRLTPDAEYKGMFFFMVSKGRSLQEGDFMNYNVAVIFSVNLELIDSNMLEQGLFTQNLMSEARKLLKEKKWAFDNFTFELVSETRDLREVYQEFSLDPTEQYNRAPMQCFRFDLNVTVEEDCITK